MRPILVIAFFTVPFVFSQSDMDLRIHGFVSQGYVQSNSYDYLVERSQEGSFEFTELALNFFARPAPKLSVGIQIFARDLGHEGNNEPVIDWAVADYRWRDSLGFRLGKVKAPLGFYNKGRDADILRPSVFLPQGVYAEDFRDITLAYQGAGIYGLLGKGALEYELYVGTTNLDENLRVFRDLFAQFGLPFQDPSFHIDILYGTALRWSPPLEGLSLGTSMVRANAHLEDRGSPIALHMDGIEILSFSLEYLFERWIASAEYSSIELPVENATPGLELPPFPDFKPEAWYVQLAWQARDKLQLSYQYDVSYSSKTDRDGERFILAGLPGYLAWQKDNVLAVRYDLSSHITLKAEGRLISGAARAIIDYTDSSLDKNWSFYAAKASFNF